MQNWDVTVVGGGPVGTVTALGLAEAGLSVRLIEKRAVLGSQERATTFHPPTLEMLDTIGLADPLIDRGIICTEYQFRDAELGRVAVLNYDVLQGFTPYPYRLQVEQSVLTGLAREKIAAHPRITLDLGAEVTSVTDLGEEVSITLGTGETFTSSWLIGADGSRSLVRETTGAEFVGRTYPERYLVVSTSLHLEEIFPGLSPVNYVAGNPNWHVLLQNPAGWRMLFPIRPDEDVRDEDRYDEALTRMKTLLPDAESSNIDHVTIYEVNRRVASSFRTGRLILVGDAAHVNNPLGGMGMNSGVQDGMLLVPHLAAVIHEQSDLDALDQWAADRHEVALNFVGKETDNNWSQVRASSDEERAAVRAGWEELETDPVARQKYLLRASMLDSLELSSR